jgi:hypothetical protein
VKPIVRAFPENAERNALALRIAHAIEVASTQTIGTGKRAYTTQALQCLVRDDGFIGTVIFVNSNQTHHSYEVVTVHASGRTSRHGSYRQHAVTAVLEVL